MDPGEETSDSEARAPVRGQVVPAARAPPLLPLPTAAPLQPTPGAATGGGSSSSAHAPRSSSHASAASRWGGMAAPVEHRARWTDPAPAPPAPRLAPPLQQSRAEDVVEACIRSSREALNAFRRASRDPGCPSPDVCSRVFIDITDLLMDVAERNGTLPSLCDRIAAVRHALLKIATQPAADGPVPSRAWASSHHDSAAAVARSVNVAATELRAALGKLDDELAMAYARGAASSSSSHARRVSGVSSSAVATLVARMSVGSGSRGR